MLPPQRLSMLCLLEAESFHLCLGLLLSQKALEIHVCTEESIADTLA